MARTGGHAGFFSPAQQSNTQTGSELSFINVGGELFHALAVALIDNLKRASHVEERLLKTLLDRFFLYYPKLKTQLPYLSPAEQMGMLMNGPRKSEKVECLAFVLRQLVVDEMYAHPLNHREVLSALDANTAQSFLRESTTVLPSSVLGVVAQSLGITITLSSIEHGKEIRKRDVFAGNSVHGAKLELVLQVQDGYYFPKVGNKADFVYVGQLAISPPEPVVNADENMRTIAPFVALIEADNKRLLQTFLQWRENLLTMIKSKELTTANLMDFYIKFLPNTNGTIADTTAFFSRLTHATETPVTEVSLSGPNRQLNELLASSLAGWISTRKIEVEQLFECIEAQTGPSASPA